MIAGRGESGAIVCTPAPGMLKSIVFAAPVAALESRIAWRSEPGPLSPVFETRNVDSSVRSSTTRTAGPSGCPSSSECSSACGPGRVALRDREQSWPTQHLYPHCIRPGGVRAHFRWVEPHMGPESATYMITYDQTNHKERPRGDGVPPGGTGGSRMSNNQNLVINFHYFDSSCTSCPPCRTNIESFLD